MSGAATRLAAYPLYHATLGELGLRCGRDLAAGEHFRAALALARNPMERRFLEERSAVCEQGVPHLPRKRMKGNG